MTPRKQKFLEKYLEGSSAAEAALHAGYGKKHPAAQGQRLLKDPEVKSAIASACSKSEAAAAWNAEKAVKEFEQLKQNAAGESQYAAAIKAVENICRIKGLFAAEKQEITVKDLAPAITFQSLCAKKDEATRKKIRNTTARRGSKA